MTTYSSKSVKQIVRFIYLAQGYLQHCRADKSAVKLYRHHHGTKQLRNLHTCLYIPCITLCCRISKAQKSHRIKWSGNSHSIATEYIDDTNRRLRLWGYKCASVCRSRVDKNAKSGAYGFDGNHLEELSYCGGYVYTNSSLYTHRDEPLEDGYQSCVRIWQTWK